MRRLVSALFLLLVFAPACAEEPTTLNARAQAIEAQVWSPYCPGRLLIDCTTQQASELRAEITKRLDRGQSADEVLEWIRRNHGDEALARPAGRGAGLVIWLVPAAIFAVGAIALVTLIRRWSKATAHNL